MKALVAQIIALSYSTSEALAEMASTGSTIFISLKDTKISPTSNYIVASTLAATTGIIHWITNYYFQGTVIKNRADQKAHEEHKAQEKLLQHEFYSLKKSALYLITKYVYISFDLAVEFSSLYLLWSATEAWLNDLNDGEDIPLTTISGFKLLILCIYFFGVDVLFFMTNEVYEALERITEHFGFQKGKRPDEKFIKLFLKLVKPLAQKPYFREYVRIVGTLADTIEHIIPLVIIIPPSWILTLLAQPVLYSSSVIAGFSALLALVTGTILGQTYFFEGDYSVRNLLEIAYEDDENYEEILKAVAPQRSISPKLSWIADKLLNLPGAVHGCDAALAITLAFREMGMPPALSYSAGGAVLTASWIGNHWSEVKESQAALKRITKGSLASRLIESKASLLYKYPYPKYGSQNSSVQSNEFNEDDNGVEFTRVLVT